MTGLQSNCAAASKAAEGAAEAIAKQQPAAAKQESAGIVYICLDPFRALSCRFCVTFTKEHQQLAFDTGFAVFLFRYCVHNWLYLLTCDPSPSPMYWLDIQLHISSS